MPRTNFYLLIAAGVALCGLTGWFGRQGSEARRDANQFIIETLSQQQGKTWDRLGQYMFFSYDFEDEGCTLVATRHAEFAEDFKQIIPLAQAAAVGVTDSEMVFNCSGDRSCITHHVYNLQENADRQMVRTRLSVMDPTMMEPLANAFTELHRLCSDPYSQKAPPAPAMPRCRSEKFGCQ